MGIIANHHVSRLGQGGMVALILSVLPGVGAMAKHDAVGCNGVCCLLVFRSHEAMILYLHVHGQIYL